MSDAISFDLSEDVRALILTDRDDFLSELRSEMEPVLRAHADFFRYDCNEARGEIQEDTISIDDLEIDDTGEGKAYYRVDEYLYMGCRDISGTTDHDGQFPFSYDASTGAVFIPYRELPERPPDEI